MPGTFQRAPPWLVIPPVRWWVLVPSGKTEAPVVHEVGCSAGMGEDELVKQMVVICSGQLSPCWGERTGQGEHPTSCLEPWQVPHILKVLISSKP